MKESRSYVDEIHVEPTARESDNNPKEQPPPNTNTTLSLGEYQSRLEPMTELSPGEKWVLVKVRKLSNGRGCVASNRQIAEYIGIPFRTVTGIIPDLINKGYLNVDFPQSKNRSLFCSTKLD